MSAKQSSTSKSGTGELVRLSVNMNRPTAEALREYAERHDISITEAVRRVVATADFLDKEIAAGHKVQVQGEGVVRELVFT